MVKGCFKEVSKVLKCQVCFWKTSKTFKGVSRMLIEVLFANLLLHGAHEQEDGLFLLFEVIHERRKLPCSDQEFEIHNHIDYARTPFNASVHNQGVSS